LARQAKSDKPVVSLDLRHLDRKVLEELSRRLNTPSELAELSAKDLISIHKSIQDIETPERSTDDMSNDELLDALSSALNMPIPELAQRISPTRVIPKPAERPVPDGPPKAEEPAIPAPVSA
jgi:hypothetical protein